MGVKTKKTYTQMFDLIILVWNNSANENNKCRRQVAIPTAISPISYYILVFTAHKLYIDAKILYIEHKPIY